MSESSSGILLYCGDGNATAADRTQFGALAVRAGASKHCEYDADCNPVSNRQSPSMLPASKETVVGGGVHVSFFAKELTSRFFTCVFGGERASGEKSRSDFKEIQLPANASHLLFGAMMYLVRCSGVLRERLCRTVPRTKRWTQTRRSRSKLLPRKHWKCCRI